MSAFSQRLLELRRDQGLRQPDVARAIGVSLRTYQYYESAQKEPALSALVALAELFDVSLDYLVGRSSKSTDNNSDEALVCAASRIK